MLDARRDLLPPARRVSLAAQQRLLLPKTASRDAERDLGTRRGVGRVGSSCASAEAVLPAPTQSLLVLLPGAASQGSFPAPTFASCFLAQISVGEHFQDTALQKKKTNQNPNSFQWFAASAALQQLQLRAPKITHRSQDAGGDPGLVPRPPPSLPVPAPARSSHVSRAHFCSSLIHITLFLFRWRAEA